MTNARRYWIGPWEETPEGFDAPAGTLGRMDLRAPAVGDKPGLGLFVTADETLFSSEYELVGRGDLRDISVSGGQIAAFRSLCKPQGDYAPETLLDCVVDLFSVNADPLGEKTVKPILPSETDSLELYLGGHSLVWSETTVRTGDCKRHGRWKAAREVLRKDLEAIRDDSHAGRCVSAATGRKDDTYHRQVLSAYCEGFHCHESELRTKKWRKNETLLPHNTTIADDFNRANTSNTLGTASGGFTYTSLTNNRFEIISNQAKFGPSETGTDEKRADADLSTVNQAVWMTLVELAVNSGQVAAVGILGRKDGTATRTYYEADTLFGTTNSRRLRKLIAASATVLASYPEVSVANDIQQLQISGSQLVNLVNGTLKAKVTDTSISSGLRCGFKAAYNASAADAYAIVDSWSAEDFVGRLFRASRRTRRRMFPRGQRMFREQGV